MEVLLTIGGVLFIIYKLYMSATRKERELMYQLMEEDNKPKSKPKYYEFYKKGKVVNYIDNPKNIGKDYQSIANLNIKNENIGRIEVIDLKTGKLLGSFVDKRLCNNIKDDDYIYSTIHTTTTCKRGCTCYYCYRDKEHPFEIGVHTLIKTNEEEVAKMIEIENDLTQKNRRKLNNYLRSVDLFEYAKKSRRKLPS